MASDEAGATVSLMPEGALLLAGDAIAIDVSVGPGARVELVEPAGTVAYGMDGGSASWDVTIELAAGATLMWAAEPFVVAEGATVERSTTIRLGDAAVMAWRETLVLGRHGERSGHLRQVLEVTDDDDVPMLVEELEVGPGSSRLLLGGARTIGSVLVLGHRLPAGDADEAGTRLELEADGTMLRHLADEAHRASPAWAWAAARRVVG
ncbi:MAG: urease accessory protein UreD [Aeromicrobium sp.]